MIGKKSLVLGAVLLTTMIARARDGGVIGGGGNVLFPVDPKYPASVTEVKSAIVGIRPALVRFFRAKQEAYRGGTLSKDEAADFGALFNSSAGIVTISESTNVEVEGSEPCFDAQAQPVDGSTFLDHAPSVCLSAFSISQKVERGDLQAQSAALLAHEFSELTGFQDEQAVRVQARVLDAFRGAGK